MPLAGLRIAVKDVFHLQGLSTSAGSKTYQRFHRAAAGTSSSIKQLISMGATIVGKTKTVQFASAEPPTSWIDFQCPFNPRADGY